MKKSVLFALVVFAMLSFSLLSLDLKFVDRIDGKVKGNRFGTMISSVGDVNGDGYTDFAVAAPGSYTVKKQPGEVHIFYGGSSFDNTADLVLKGETGSDLFGSSITPMGDFDSDGFDDFAISAPRNDGTYTDAGKVYIYKGGEKPDTKAYLSLTGERANDWFGISIAGGKDINGDNQPDLLIGASYAGSNYSGAVYVFLGGGDFGNPDLKIEGERPGDNFGQVVCIPGDITGDKINDFIVSASYNDAGGVKNAGAVYIYKGGSVISKKPMITLTGDNVDENYGYSIDGAGDVNGDGIDDFIVGSLGGGSNNEGAAMVYTGGKVIRDKPFMRMIGQNPKDMTGRVVSNAGDINNDGFADIMVGSPYSDIGFYRNGRVDVYLGGKEADIISDYHILGEKADAQCGFYIERVPNFFGKKGRNNDLYIVNCAGKESGFSDISSILLYK
ncbi:MAG: integrin alpha [Candidatus Zixiibacteriota bacterium]